MDFGLSTCICPRMPLQHALPWLSEYGVNRVEYATFNLMMSSPNSNLREEYIESRDAWSLVDDDIPADEIREISSSHGMIPVQVHSPDYSLWEPDPRRRDLAIEKISVMLRICSELEAPVLIIHLETPDSMPTNARDIATRVVEPLRTLAGRASELGITIAIENSWRDLFGSRPGDLTEIIGSSDPDHVSACLDTGHAYRLGLSPGDMGRELGACLGATHIHDYDGRSDHLPPFAGAIDWSDLCSALTEAGYTKTLIGEIEGSQDPMASANRLLLSKLALGRLLELVPRM